MRSGAVVVSVALAGAGCGAGADSQSRSHAVSAQVQSTEYAASPTLSRGSGDELFAVRGLGRFRAVCVRPGVARIEYTAASDSATQLVSRQTAGGARPSASLNPGERAATTIRSRSAPRADWQVAILSEGRINIFTGSFT